MRYEYLNPSSLDTSTQENTKPNRPYMGGGRSSDPVSRLAHRESSSNKPEKTKALNLPEIHTGGNYDDMSSRPSKLMGLPPIMPKTRSKDNLLQIRNNIRDLTHNQSGIQSVIE